MGISPSVKPELSPAWRQWLMMNLVDGVDADELVKTLAKLDIARSTATAWLAEVRASEDFKRLASATRPIRQSRQYLTLRRQLNQLRHDTAQVREHHALSALDFFQDYYCENRPVLLRGYAVHWPAFKKWRPDWLKNQYGDVTVNITDNRDSNPRYDMEHKHHTRQCSMAEYVDLVCQNKTGNNTYMVANNRNIEDPAFASILKDVIYDDDIFDRHRWKGCTAFWFGPSGTVTPLHHDTCNILFVQLFGRKRFRLYAPLESDLLVGARSMYADVDPESPDETKHPNFSNVQCYDTTLNPGDAIFLPIGWWHHVRALDISISLAMTNFVEANYFDWFRPGEVR